jgi:hypothetical protein
MMLGRYSPTPCPSLDLGCPKPPTEAHTNLSALDRPSLRPEFLAEASSDPPGAPPPPSTHLRPPSHGRSPTTRFIGFPSSALARLGDPRPPRTWAHLVSGDLTIAGERGVAHSRPEPLNPPMRPISTAHPWSYGPVSQPGFRNPDANIITKCAGTSLTHMMNHGTKTNVTTLLNNKSSLKK